MTVFLLIASLTFSLCAAFHPGCHFRKRQTASTSKQRIRPLPRRSGGRLTSLWAGAVLGSELLPRLFCFYLEPW